jgi:hypothetical protein
MDALCFQLFKGAETSFRNGAHGFTLRLILIGPIGFNQLVPWIAGSMPPLF